MFIEVVDHKLKDIENIVKDSTSQDELFESLRSLGLEDFGLLLLSMPNPAYPKISNILPRMASEEIQRNWTGDAGVNLLRHTLNFVRSIAYYFSKYTGETLENKTILDFGCGYGRIARLMYYFTNPDNFFAVDPWDKSLEICNADGLIKNFYLSDYLPAQLPTGDKKFSLIYAFSVFTHLSEKATRISLNTLLNHLEPNGLLVITIRPIEYWSFEGNFDSPETRDRLISSHRQTGFSFLPHLRDAVDGDITYGDTSMTLEWLKNLLPTAEILGTDRSIFDPYQIYVFIRQARR
jgi:SAM-dependent methyltransferase